MHNCEKRNKIHVLQHTKVPFFKKRLYILIIHARKVCINLRVSKKNLNFAHFFAVDCFELTHKNLKIVNLQTAFSKNNKTSRILRYKKNMRTLFTKTTLLLCALLLSVNMLGNTVSSTNSSEDVKNGKIEMKGNHATFYLSGVSAYEYNWRSSKAYAIGTVGKQSSKTLTLSWVADGDYDIKVTNIRFYAKAYTSGEWAVKNGKIVVAGSEYTIGTINTETRGFDEINESGDFPGDISIVCKNNGTGYSFDYFIKNITITYTATPKIQTKTGSVELTICPEAPKTIDLNTCITNKDNHLSYTFSCTAEGANIEETTFSASRIGDYTVNVAVGKEDNCHEAASTSFTVIVTPAALTLTAPTASDIIYHQTLDESGLTGGKASVGSCEVTGKWAWEYPETTPSIGDNQPFLVVFTPSENGRNYTNFETTALVDVKRAQYIFDGSGDGEGDEWWCENDNWNVDAAPSIEDSVLVQHNVLIACEVYAYSVEIAEGKTITIAPEGGLTVGAGGIIGANRNNLILKAGTEGETKGKTGYLRISPEYTGAMPEATVELYTIGYYNMNVGNHQDVGTWQYVGSPMVNDGTLARNVFTKNMLYDWNEATGEWKNNLRRLVLQPFTGYATSQYNEEGRLVTNQGQLVDNGVVVLPLTYTESSATPGCNVLANSFSAPIDISRIETTDFSEGVDATIHLFNTGSKMDLEALSEKKSVASIDVNAAGQYLSIPVINAKTLNSEFGYPILIPSMQGFYVNTDRAGTLTLDYEKLVWNANLKASPNIPLRAPKRSIEEEQTISGALQVTLTTDGMTDNLFLLEAEHYDASFENGLDARKKMSCAFNIFAIEDSAQLAVDATNSIIGTRVGVRTGDETAYTLVFSHLKTENALALLDNETEETIDINEGLEYTFFAEPNSVITERFQIVERANAPAVATGTENAKNGVKAHKFIKDGQLYVLKNGVLYNAMGAVVR